MTEPEPRWLLLLHQIPPKPDYVRVKIWRRLQALGAIAVKNSAYLLPWGDQAREDLQWVQKEVEQSGGEASICEARFVDGLRDEEIEGLFNAERDNEYATLAHDIQTVIDGLPEGQLDDDQLKAARTQLRRLKKRLDQIAGLDYFRASGRDGVEGLLSTLDGRLQLLPLATDAVPCVLATADYRGRTWITRRGIHVDRMASAWLIRRFIDPQARFWFVSDRIYAPSKDEVRFDMFQGEFTHEGDACTFEVLINRFGIEERALTPIAEIVHDIDLKDGKFKREEAAGVAATVAGIGMGTQDDEERLAQATVLFESLFRFFSTKRSSRPVPPPSAGA